MYIATVDYHMLPGYVTGLRRHEEQNHSSNFVGIGHALAERNLRGDLLKFFVRIWKRAKPLFVERSHHFRGEQGVHANTVGEQFRSPLACKREDRAFCRSIARGATLSGHRYLGG